MSKVFVSLSQVPLAMVHSVFDLSFRRGSG